MGAELQPVECLGAVVLPETWERKAAIHIADRVAADYPHPPGDDHNAGRRLAYNPHAKADLLDLLDALGLDHDHIRRTA